MCTRIEGWLYSTEQLDCICATLKIEGLNEGNSDRLLKFLRIGQNDVDFHNKNQQNNFEAVNNRSSESNLDAANLNTLLVAPNCEQPTDVPQEFLQKSPPSFRRTRKCVRRFLMSPASRKILLDFYKQCEYPTTGEKFELATKTGLTEAQVAKFFSNQRQKMKLLRRV